VFTEHISSTGKAYRRKIEMAKYNRIVSIGAHPLDAELMGGPMLIKYAEQGADGTFVHVTKGRLTDLTATEEEKQAYETALNDEIEHAAATMGCNSFSMNYISAELPDVEVFTNVILEYLRREKADCVITHARGTLHPRHYYTYEAVTQAVRILHNEGNPIQIYYGENCEDLIGFTPTVYVSMSEQEMKTWFEGLQNYKIFRGKINDVPYFDYYHSMGTIRAIEAGSHGFVKAYMHGALIDNE